MTDLSVWTRDQLKSKPFPDSLLIVPTGRPDMPRYTRDAYVSHNTAVQAWQKARAGAMSNVKPCERALLDMVAAVENYITTDEDEATGGGWTAEYVIAPILTGMGNALNLDMGRLDGATMAAWIWHTAERVGLDPDTY